MGSSSLPPCMYARACVLIVMSSLIWLALICVSRIYLGLHCPAGVMCGFFVGIVVVLLCEHLGCSKSVDSIVTSLQGIQACLILPSTGFLLLILYPSPPKSSRLSYPDTASVLGLTFGLLLGDCTVKPVSFNYTPLDLAISLGSDSTLSKSEPLVPFFLQGFGY